jgi:nucleoside-diphosphate-sugar epimerase
MPYHPKPTYMMPWSVFIDLQYEICVFPGDGTQTMIFTHSSDLAAFIERLISLPADEWPRESLIMPNKIRLNEVSQIVRQVTGK